jgi:predicted membrane-bound mannosyltransferase
MDVFAIVNRIRQVAIFHPEGKKVYIQVICSNHDYWPLPWYLRDFKNVGWWDHVDVKIPLAPVIIASPDLESALIDKMYKIPAPGEKYLYVPLFKKKMELRPGIEIMGFIRQDYKGF